MPQNALRIEYDPYPPGARRDLTENEKHQIAGCARASHLCALFFLLRHLNLNPRVDDCEEISIQMNHLGELGRAISEGMFVHIDSLSDPASDTIPGTGLDNRGTGGGDAPSHDSIGGEQ